MSSNARRTPMSRRPDAGVTTLKTNLVLLQKGATFHAPPTPPMSSEESAVKPPSLPPRSSSNLDDVIDAHRRRVASTLSTIDKTLGLTASKDYKSTSSSVGRRTLRDTSAPLPVGILFHTIDTSIMGKEPESERRVLRPRRRSPRHHESDSGLGTSLLSSGKVSENKDEKKIPVTRMTRAAAVRSLNNLPGLSARATNRIYEHTLKPLLAKQSLKDFHPSVLECPKKIQEKEIVCLRDVEKMLLQLAPQKTKVFGVYLDFCLTTVRCIQATVEYLTDREQTRPRDLPYTSGYFIDLVDQIRQYAHQLADANDKKKLGDLDLDASDEIKLHGGLQINGRPAELVRVKKNGQAISMATGEVVEIIEEEDSTDPLRIKRSASEEAADEEEIMRSMARRKNNASPEELAPKKCREPGCDKEFKRPCDLTKHEKTHSRPWKCPVPTCKYHDYGWPTEKEMDRHHNDKHSSAPPMYECMYKPCPYKSKRESNCKQHMEKAHGWTYVRTKTNGKAKPGPFGSNVSVPHTTPQLHNMPTPGSDRSMSVSTPDDNISGRFYGIEFPTIAQTDFDFNTIPQEITLDYSPIDNATPSSTDSGMDHSTYQDMGIDFTLQEDIYGAHVRLPHQLPAPVHQMFAKGMHQPPFIPYTAPEMCQPQPQPAHFSPAGQGNTMLYTPQSLAEVEDSFEDQDYSPMSSRKNTAQTHMDNGDFVLFPGGNTTTNAAKAMTYSPQFHAEVPSVAAGYSQPNSQEFMNSFNNIDWTAAAMMSQGMSQGFIRQ